MRRFTCEIYWLTLLGFLLASVPSHAQSTDLASRLIAASDLTSLELVNPTPWHLKLDVTVFDEKGSNPKPGTIEVWHSNDNERETFTFGNASHTQLRTHAGSYRESNGGEIPYTAFEIEQAVLAPGPQPGDVNESKPELRKQKLGKNEFDCIMLSQPIKGTNALPLGLFPTYCLDSAGIIRATYDFGSTTVVLKKMGKFLGHEVPVQLDLLNGQVVVGTANVVTLSSYTPEENEFLPTDAMKLVRNMARISGGVIQGTRINFVQPVYPQSMKAGRVSGTVILRAIIGSDGHVRRLRSMSATDPEFVIAAIAAVRQWTYKPYILNGEPTAVDTTITVNFQIQ